MPEPTMASKVGCIAFGLHGSDVAGTGLKQVWTGQDTRTLVQQGTTKLAEAMRVAPDLADNIGLSLDIAVPFGISGMLGAVRASSIQMGRINLAMHEAKPGSQLGGHTLLKHVGKTEAELRARLVAEPSKLRVSSFTNQQIAEWAISEVMRANTAQISSWVRSGSSSRMPPLRKHVGRSVGVVLARGAQKPVPGQTVVVLLKREQYNGMPYYILTAYVD